MRLLATKKIKEIKGWDVEDITMNLMCGLEDENEKHVIIGSGELEFQLDKSYLFATNEMLFNMFADEVPYVELKMLEDLGFVKQNWKDIKDVSTSAKMTIEVEVFGDVTIDVHGKDEEQVLEDLRSSCQDMSGKIEDAILALDSSSDATEHLEQCLVDYGYIKEDDIESCSVSLEVRFR